MNLAIKLLIVVCLIESCALQSICGVNGCLSCSSANICTSCATEYQINSNHLCIACNIPNCLSCSNNNICSQCNGKDLVSTSSGNNCVTCNVSNCISCESNNICGVCSNGYDLSTVYFNNVRSTLCSLCSIANCQYCASSNNNTCSYCSNGFSLVNNSCVLCSYPCTYCNASGACTVCSTPYFIYTPSSNGSCIPASVQNCQTYSTNTTTNLATCTDCGYNYVLNPSSNQCSFLCSSNCNSCDPATPTQCNYCN